MPRAVVIGSGMVGSVIAADLAGTARWKVTLADASKPVVTKAAKRIERVVGRAVAPSIVDCTDADAVHALIDGADVVVGAVPGHLGLGLMRTVIEAGVPMCDISFMPEDFRELHALAEKRGTTVVADCGVAPGMSNLLCGVAARQLDEVEHVDIMVGGLPRERHLPWEYKAGFSPIDVFEEYTRPARVVEGGRIVEKDALSEPEMIEFDGVGTLEAFLTDGLRSLADTLPGPSMRERTLRYPGHRALMHALRHAGLFGEEPIDVRGTSVVPRDVLAALLFPQWTFEEGEADLTVMRIAVDGVLDGVRTRLAWDLVDRLDPETGFTSMSRTTGFTAAICARLIADGTIDDPGVHPPEHLASIDGVPESMVKQLRKRGVRYDARVESLD